MTGLLDWILPLALLFSGAILTPIIGAVSKRAGVKKIEGFFTALIFVFTIWALINIYGPISTGTIGEVQYLSFGPSSGGAVLHIDMLSWLMAIIFVSLGFLVVIYSIIYMERDTGLEKYYTLILTLVGGLIGIVFAGDFFTFFVFWELMAVSSYILVSFRKEQWEPIEAGFKYLIMSAFGSILMLYSMSFLYGLTGTLNFELMGTYLAGASPNLLLYLLIGMLIVGFGVKAAVVPLHTWLPDAHPAAPSSISALLSGIIVKSGVYGILRVFLTLFAPSVFTNYGVTVAIFAVITMSVGNIMALVQTDIKRLLAYSTIANIGYILLGFAVGMTPGVSAEVAQLGVMSGLFHLLNHALLKGLLFLCAGAFLYRAKTRDLNKLSGIGRKMPLTGVIFTVGALALSGMPPLNGFYSKAMVIWATISVYANISSITYAVLAALAILNSVIVVAYYLRMIEVLLIRKPEGNLDRVRESPVVMLIPLVLLMMSAFVIGLWQDPFITVIQLASQALP